MSEARQKLAAAMQVRDEAASRVTVATELAMKAAGVVSDIERRRLDAEQIRHDHIADRAADLRKALLAGTAAMQPDEIRRLENADLRQIEEDLAVARHAHADLVRDQEQAQADLGRAETAVAATVQPCIFAEADAIADEIEDLESRARALRLKLHGVQNIWTSNGAISLPMRIISLLTSLAQTMMMETSIAVRQSGDNSTSAWQALSKALVKDADAQLSYEPYQSTNLTSVAPISSGPRVLSSAERRHEPGNVSAILERKRS